MSHHHAEVENSRILLRETLLSWSRFSKTERSCQTLIGGILSNTSSCVIVYTLCICLRTVPRKLCCCAIHLHCVFTWIYCQQSSDPAINNRCVDLLRVFSLLFILKAVSVEDWFNTYLGYLQCVFRCTRVPCKLGHIDVLMNDGVHVRTSWVIIRSVHTRTCWRYNGWRFSCEFIWRNSIDGILHDEISPSNCIYMQCHGYESQSSPRRSREQSCLA